MGIWPLFLVVGTREWTSRKRKKTGGRLSKNTQSRYLSRVPHWPGSPRYGNTTGSRFRRATRAILTLDMVVCHGERLSASVVVAGSRVAAR